jgi:hypothetical protein
MTSALQCPRCGAALTTPVPPPPFFNCVYCGATVALAGSTASVGPSSPEAAAAARDAPEKTPAQRFTESVVASIKASMTPHDALRTSADAHLSPAGQGDAIAKITLCLAADFDAANRTALSTDAMSLARIALAYHGAVAPLRDHGTAKLTLPFLTATSEGPVHFERTLTPAEVSAMYQRPAAAPKKRGWWPFGG